MEHTAKTDAEKPVHISATNDPRAPWGTPGMIEYEPTSWRKRVPWGLVAIALCNTLVAALITLNAVMTAKAASDPAKYGWWIGLSDSAIRNQSAKEK